MTNPSTSAEQITRQAKDLGCEIPRSDSRVLIVKLAPGRDLTVKFDRSGRIREAEYDTARGVRRGIRPARVGAVLGVLFSEVYDTVHGKTEETTVPEPTKYELKTITVEAADLRTGDRLPVIGQTYANSIRRIEVIDGETVNVWIEGGPTGAPWLVLDAERPTQIQRPTPVDEYTPDDGETFADGMIRLQREHARRVAVVGGEEQFSETRLIDFGRNALTVLPVSATDAENTQRRIDWAASEILKKSIAGRPAEPIRYTAELISASQRYDSFVTGPAHAAQVLAREAIRLALNERLAEIEASAKVSAEREAQLDELPEHSETGPISVDVHGPFDHPVFEVGRWDTEEGAFVHVVSLTRDEADALHTALGRTLLG